MIMKRFVFLISLLFLLPSACAPTTPSPANSPLTASASGATPSFTSPSIPVLLPTGTHIFVPSVTPTFWPSPNGTQIAKATSNQATWNAKHTSFPITQTAREDLLSHYPGHCYSLEYMISPNNDWLAQDCMGEGLDQMETYKILVTRRGEGGSISVPYRQLFDNPDVGPMYDYFPYNMGSLPLLFWSPDSQYIYFIRHFCCIDYVVPYGSFDMSYLTSALFRLDIESGQWSKTIEDANDYYLSSTGRRIAYVTMYPAQMNILDLQTGKIQSFRLQGAIAVGYVIWSEDGLTLFFSTNQGPEDFHSGTIFNYNIYELDLLSAKLTPISYYAKSEAIVFPVGLTDDNKLILRFEQHQPDYVESTQYNDLNTNKVITLTPTP